MTDLPRAGWYPDPHVPDQMRFWDGATWTDQTFAAPQANRVLGYRFALLGQAVRAGLVLYLVASLAEVALHVWGLSMFDHAFAIGDIGRLSRYDDLNAALTIGEGIVGLATGIVWLIWQYQLADSARPGELDRSAGWHVGSWFIPFANLVMPFQNMRSLWRRFVSPDSLVVGWWWATVLASGLSVRIASASGSSGGLDGVKTEVGWRLAATLIAVGACVLAIRVAHKLTLAGLANSASGGRSGLLEPPGAVQQRHLPQLRQDRPGPLAGPGQGSPRPF